MIKVAAYTLAFGLLSSFVASAQEPSMGQAQQQSAPAQPRAQGQTSAPDHTIPPPPQAQPQAPLADQSKPAAVGPAQANTAGSMPGGMPPGATPQTMPSTISAENAALDKLPITALQLPLTDEQKALIAKSVAAAPNTQSNAQLSKAHVAGFLSSDVPLRDFSGELTQQYPMVARYKYVKLADRILIVDPPIQTVVGEVRL
jgi:hypothetical protein